VGGEPLDLEKNYNIVTNDFTAAGGDTYIVFKDSSAYTNLGVAMEDALIEYLQENFDKGTISADSKYATPQGRIKKVGVTIAATTATGAGGKAEGGKEYEPGATVTLKATPNANFTFDGWYEKGVKVSTANPYIFTAEADRTLEAKFNAPVTGGGDGGTMRFTITFNSKGGSSVPSQSVEPDDTVTKPADPKKAGSTFTGWYTDNNCTHLYDFSEKVTKSFTLYAGWKEGEEPGGGGSATTPPHFTDVHTGDWFNDDIEYVYKKGLMLGTSDDKFSPNTNLSRAMIVTILYRLEYEPNVDELENPFSDVTANQYYTKAVLWAAENGIVNGYHGEFSPNDYISRQDLAVILYRYAVFAEKKLTETRNYPGFSDASSIASYAKVAVEALYKAGVINGKPNNKFDPGGNATRAETAAMLHRFLEN